MLEVGLNNVKKVLYLAMLTRTILIKQNISIKLNKQNERPFDVVSVFVTNIIVSSSCFVRLDLF